MSLKKSSRCSFVGETPNTREVAMNKFLIFILIFTGSVVGSAQADTRLCINEMENV